MSSQTASQFACPSTVWWNREIGSESEEYMKSLKIPYIPQININACGAAALEMIYKYYGLNDVNQQELMKKYQELEPHGSGNFRLTTDNLINGRPKQRV